MLSRKVRLNLLLVIICGALVISIPVIVGNLYRPAAANADQARTNWVLVSHNVGERYRDTLDTLAIWQIEKRYGDTVVATWEEIYAAITASNPIGYDTANLLLTPYGLVYRGSAAALTGYTSTVTYQGRTCVLKFK